MKKLRRLWQRIPARIQACTNLALIGLCVLLIYIFVGSPPLSVRHAFRLAEKAELVGPSKILARIQPEGTPYRHLMLADDGSGVTLFTFSRWDPDATELVYIEKTGDLTVTAAPDATFYPAETDAVVPIILFHSEADAVRAELDITITADHQGAEHRQTWNLASEQRHDGCFLFFIRSHSQTALGAEGQLLFTLQTVSGNSMAYTRDTVIPTTARLYDRADNLIREETVLIRSAAARANAQ